MKRKHQPDETGVNLGIIITPMLDMAFQLMAFFIMTYNPSALEAHIDGTLLPPTKVATKGPDTTPMEMDIPPIDTEPQLLDVLMVTVKAVPKGQTEGSRLEGEPSKIFLKRPESPTADVVGEVVDGPVDDKKLTHLHRLEAELKKIVKESGPGANIKIEGDGKLKHRFTVQVYDVCKQAGFKNVAFVAPVLDKKAGK
jgi:biopolymer transport protein ExbD